MGQSQASRFSSKKILNCVPKTIEAFTGLERHGGKGDSGNDNIFILGGLTL